MIGAKTAKQVLTNICMMSKYRIGNRTVKLSRLDVPILDGDDQHWKTFSEQFCIANHGRKDFFQLHRNWTTCTVPLTVLETCFSQEYLWRSISLWRAVSWSCSTSIASIWFASPHPQGVTVLPCHSQWPGTQSLVYCQNPSLLQPLWLYRSDKERHDGISLVPWKSGKSLIHMYGMLFTRTSLPFCILPGCALPLPVT